MSAESIVVFRAEVLDHDVHKYSSSRVEGGGGYVATVNGATYGGTEAVRTTVQHHVDQDIWLRDLESDRQFQINLTEMAFPVRPGHILQLALDRRSNEWERLYNETTGQLSYGNGGTNPNAVAGLRKRAKWYYPANIWVVLVFVFLLSFPMLSIFAAPILVPIFALAAWNTKVLGKRVSGGVTAAVRVLVSGALIFITSMVGTILLIDHDLGRDYQMLTNLLQLPFAGEVVLVLYLISAVVFFGTTFGRNNAAAAVLQERSAAIDAKMAELSKVAASQA